MDKPGHATGQVQELCNTVDRDDFSFIQLFEAGLEDLQLVAIKQQLQFSLIRSANTCSSQTEDLALLGVGDLVQVEVVCLINDEQCRFSIIDLEVFRLSCNHDLDFLGQVALMLQLQDAFLFDAFEVLVGKDKADLGNFRVILHHQGSCKCNAALSCSRRSYDEESVGQLLLQLGLSNPSHGKLTIVGASVNLTETGLDDSLLPVQVLNKGASLKAFVDINVAAALYCAQLS